MNIDYDLAEKIGATHYTACGKVAFYKLVSGATCFFFGEVY